MSNTVTNPGRNVLNGVTARRHASVTDIAQYGQLDGIGEAAFQLAWYGLGPQTTGQRPAQDRVRVFLLGEGSKVPLRKRGCHDATSDVDMVFNMWLKYPFANIGVATGNGLVVIDIDPRNGGTVDPRLPATYTVQTPNSAGLHLYYTTDQDIPNSAGRLAQGVDVRGRGGHVVAPPSWTLIDGERREWRVIDPRPPVSMPTWLVDACLGSSARRSSGPRRSSGFRPAEEGSVEIGGRNDYIARFVGWALSQGVENAELDEMVSIENETTCVPPLPKAEVERVTGNIRRLHRDRSTGTRT